MILRPYQTAAIEALRGKLRDGKRRLVLVAPTGSGKTVMAAEIIRSATQRGSRVLVIAHRRELINQTCEKLARFGVAAGVQMGADARRRPDLPTQVATIQTLGRRLDRLPQADLVVYDEVHHACSQTSRDVLRAYGTATVLGLTATPWRSDRFGLADLFEDLVVAATPAELIASGALVPYEAFAYEAPDLRRVHTVAGEYNQHELEVACNTQILVGSVVREYLAHARGRRAIVFPVSIVHSKALVAEFEAAGLAAAHVDCYMPTAARDGALQAFARGELRVVSSVGVLTEGFDCPAAEVCILARPTKSLTLHLQMIGRVLRPFDGKARALVHDHAGNLVRHGFPDDVQDYSLRATPKRVRDLHTCPFCSFLFGALKQGCCPKCGELLAEPPKPEAASPRETPEVELDGERLSMDEIRERRRRAGIERSLTDEQLRKVLAATPYQRAAEYLRLRLVAAEKGFKPGFVQHQYRAVFGEWPRFTGAQLAGVVAARYPFLPIHYVDRRQTAHG